LKNNFFDKKVARSGEQQVVYRVLNIALYSSGGEHKNKRMRIKK
jgi:hypothetical protein